MDIRIAPHTNVLGFGYRTADVKNALFEIRADHREEKEIREYNMLHSDLAEKAGIRVDNHQTFVVEDDDKKLVIRFSDYRIIIGTDIIVGRW